MAVWTTKTNKQAKGKCGRKLAILQDGLVRTVTSDRARTLSSRRALWCRCRPHLKQTFVFVTSKLPVLFMRNPNAWTVPSFITLKLLLSWWSGSLIPAFASRRLTYTEILIEYLPPGRVDGHPYNIKESNAPRLTFKCTPSVYRVASLNSRYMIIPLGSKPSITGEALWKRRKVQDMKKYSTTTQDKFYEICQILKNRNLTNASKFKSN